MHGMRYLQSSSPKSLSTRIALIDLSLSCSQLESVLSYVCMCVVTLSFSSAHVCMCPIICFGLCVYASYHLFRLMRLHDLIVYACTQIA